MEIKLCPICGKTFEPKPNKKYCSAECLKVATRERRRREILTKLCPICGNYFNTRTAKKYCSAECLKVATRESIRKAARTYYYKHHEKSLLCNKKNYADHVESRREWARNYYKNNTEKCREAIRRCFVQKRICKRVNERENLSKNERLELKKNICSICGKYFTPKYRDEKYCSEKCRNHPKAKKMRLFFTHIFNRYV